MFAQESVMEIQEEREAFEAWYCRNHTGLKQSDLAKFRTLSGYSFSDSLKINISWEAWQAAKAQTPVKLDKDTARQKLAMMWRGESTEINGRTVIFNESGCFDVRQDFGSGHFSQSLKATLDYLFQQRQSL